VGFVGILGFCVDFEICVGLGFLVFWDFRVLSVSSFGVCVVGFGVLGFWVGLGVWRFELGGCCILFCVGFDICLEWVFVVECYFGFGVGGFV